VEEHLVSLLAPTSYEAEQYRTLRHLIEQLHKTADLSSVAVTSAAVGDGKTTTAINLAGTLAQDAEARVLLVDADLRQSSLASYLGLEDPGRNGVVDAILNSHLGLDDVVRRLPRFNLSVLPAGRRPSAPYEVLKSPRLEELLSAARQRYDYIVLDMPPLLHFPDCRVIGKRVDGILVVVKAHRTPRKLVDEALHVMDPSKILGLLFNRDNRPLSRFYERAVGSSTNGRARRFFSPRSRQP